MFIDRKFSMDLSCSACLVNTNTGGHFYHLRVLAQKTDFEDKDLSVWSKGQVSFPPIIIKIMSSSGAKFGRFVSSHDKRLNIPKFKAPHL